MIFRDTNSLETHISQDDEDGEAAGQLKSLVGQRPTGEEVWHVWNAKQKVPDTLNQFKSY